jgi:hypothetical protein
MSQPLTVAHRCGQLGYPNWTASVLFTLTRNTLDFLLLELLRRMRLPMETVRYLWSLSLLINWVIRVNPARRQSVKSDVRYSPQGSNARHPIPVSPARTVARVIHAARTTTHSRNRENSASLSLVASFHPFRVLGFRV